VVGQIKHTRYNTSLDGRVAGFLREIPELGQLGGPRSAPSCNDLDSNDSRMSPPLGHAQIVGLAKAFRLEINPTPFLPPGFSKYDFGLFPIF